MTVPVLLAIDDAKWLLARAAGDAVDEREIAAGDEAAASVKAALDAMLSDGRGLCLALPSHWVFAATIDCENLPRRDRHAAMLFRLEEQLPQDIESLTADFLPPAKGRTLGAAVQTARVRQVLDRLAVAGIEPEVICPLSLLALWQAVQQAGPCDYAVVVADGRVDVFRMHERQPVAWYTLDDDTGDLVRCIQADRLASPINSDEVTVAVVAGPDWSTAAIENDLGLKIIHRHPEPALAAAARTAAEIAAGREAGWINFRRDALAPESPWAREGGLVRSAMVLALALLVLVSVVSLWRGMRYAAAADEARHEQAAAYRQAYPNGPLPGDVRAFLTRESTRMAGLSGAGAEAPRQAGALDSLRRAVVGLPPAVRLRILELRIAPEGIYIEGQAPTHGDAEAIKQGLARGGFAMEPPRTERLATGGVSFTLTGKLEPEGAAKPGAPAGGASAGAATAGAGRQP